MKSTARKLPRSDAIDDDVLRLGRGEQVGVERTVAQFGGQTSDCIALYHSMRTVPSVGVPIRIWTPPSFGDGFTGERASASSAAVSAAGSVVIAEGNPFSRSSLIPSPATRRDAS